MNYIYICGDCSDCYESTFEFTKPKLNEIIRVALYNVILEKNYGNYPDYEDPKHIDYYYARSDEIILFILNNWEDLCHFRYRFFILIFINFLLLFYSYKHHHKIPNSK
jgi:hypothetical protein